MNEEIVTLLDQAAELREQIKRGEIERDQEIEAVTPQDVREAVAAICAKRDAWLAALRDECAKIESRVRVGVLELGESVKGHALQAQWVNPPVKWSDSGLQGFAAALAPDVRGQLLALREIGDPTVRIVQNRGK